MSLPPSTPEQREVFGPLVIIALIAAAFAIVMAFAANQTHGDYEANRDASAKEAPNANAASSGISTPAEILAALPDAIDGDGKNYDMVLKTPDPVTRPVLPGAKTIELTATERRFKVGKKVYEMWTFNDMVPGPTMRVVEGDRVTIRITNAADSTFYHSVDFHASRISLGGGYVQVAPGKTGEFTFTADYPGVFMYHCGTPPVLHHIGLGMYGMLIVQPKQGYGRAMPEYAFTQSELYANTRDLERSLPAQMAFNGIPGQYMTKPIKVPANSEARLFVLNAGPSKVSSFHVVGTVFDRALMDGNPANETVGRQTVVLGASSGLVAEMKFVGEGQFPFVTHQFDHGAMGAGGMIQAGDGDPVGKGGKDMAEH